MTPGMVQLNSEWEERENEYMQEKMSALLIHIRHKYGWREARPRLVGD